MRWALLFLCSCGTTSTPSDAGLEADAPVVVQADITLDLDGAKSGGPLNAALLGHYDLSGALFSYDKVTGLVPAMKSAGFSEWRIGAERWELGTELLPALTDSTPCPLGGYPQQALYTGSEIQLLAERDWFTYDGNPVTEATTLLDNRYNLAYAKAAIDTALAFGATPYFDIDAMPRALSSNPTPNRTIADDPQICNASFCNRVSNVKPADPKVFAAAATGMVQRLIESGRALPYVEVWNEPDIGNIFWDKAAGSTFQDYLTMAAFTLVRLDAYRQGKNIEIGFGSFVAATTAIAVINGFDTNPVPFDFISFHSYKDDPIAIVDEIAQVANAKRASKSYANIEIALAEWGPVLQKSTLDPKTMDVALHDATVIALGAQAGLDRAHRAIFWDFYDIVPFGLLDHALKPKPAYWAYALLAKVIPGDRLVLAGHEDGRFGDVAILASKKSVLAVNRGNAGRTMAAGSLSAVTVFDDPTSAPHTVAPSAVVSVPPRSIVLLER